MSEKSLSGKFAKRRIGSRLASRSSIEKRIESAQFALGDVCHPFASLSIKRHSFDAAGVVRSFLAVAKVFAMRGKPKVFDAVISAIAIYVIDVKALGNRAVCINPCQSMRVLLLPKDAHAHIAGSFVFASAYSADHVTTPKFYGLDAHKNASFSVVAKELFDLFWRGFGVGDIHNKSC